MRGEWFFSGCRRLAGCRTAISGMPDVLTAYVPSFLRMGFADRSGKVHLLNTRPVLEAAVVAYEEESRNSYREAFWF